MQFIVFVIAIVASVSGLASPGAHARYAGGTSYFLGSLAPTGARVASSSDESQQKRDLKNIQAAYEDYLLKHTAVIEVHFESSWQIWIRLKASKYTTKSNVEKIAETIALGYASRTGEKAVVCTVWSYDAKRVYAKGYYSSS